VCRAECFGGIRLRPEPADPVEEEVIDLDADPGELITELDNELEAEEKITEGLTLQLEGKKEETSKEKDLFKVAKNENKEKEAAITNAERNKERFVFADIHFFVELALLDKFHDQLFRVGIQFLFCDC